MALSPSLPISITTSPQTPISSIPENTTLSPSSLLQTVSDFKSLKQIHAHILKTPNSLTLQTQNKLISLYSLFNHLEFAELTFQRIPIKHSFTWNMMIRGYSTNGFPDKALQLYSHMLLSDVSPDNFTFPFLLKSCSAISASYVALEAHGRIIRTGLSSDVYIATALVDMYSKLGEIDKARQVFDEIPCKNVVTWNAMIAGYAHNELDSEAQEVFKKMIEMGLEPNSSTLVSTLPAVARLSAIEEGKLIHEWVVRNGMEKNEAVSNSLIAMYGKCGELDSARRLFDKMPTKSDVSWTAIISAYAQKGMVTEALELFRRMQHEGAMPSAITVASVLPACADLVDLKLGTKIHGYSIKNGFDIDPIVGTALVDMYAKCGLFEEAKRIFNGLTDKNVVSWNAMISACGLHGFGDEALELFLLMQQHGTKPNGSTFVSIINACSHAGMVTQGLECFELMSREYRILPETKHFACVVDLFGRAGNLTEAYEFIKQMPVEPDDVVWGALLGGCRIHNNVELGEIAAERVFELKPEEAGYYILLANIYAAGGRWGDSQKLREMMRTKKMKKEAAYSSTEDGGIVHSFIVGDFRHPDWEAIHQKMEEIEEKLKEEGYVPDTSFVLHEVDEEVKDERLAIHSEKIALAFGLMKTAEGKPIRITKNLRVCGDCHAVFKLVARIYGREIVVRDSNRFHKFEGGLCSCKDYW